MTNAGYYRHPTIHQDTVVFVCEDDLWTVTSSGGVARRLTSSPGRASSPALSVDGKLLAFTGRDEGTNEVYVMPAVGGEAKRLSYFGSYSNVVTWTAKGEIIFTSNHAQPFGRKFYLYSISPAGGDAKKMPVGFAVSTSHNAEGGRVICRHSSDIARWKRYRGGTTGEIWIDSEGQGEWQKLFAANSEVLRSNVASPLWLGERIYFVSDHEGVGNLYSCTPTGEDIVRHTHHQDFYVRHPQSDGERIVYHAGADLYLFEPSTDRSNIINIELHSPRSERKRKFVSAANYLGSAQLHPENKILALTARGKVFSMNNWEGAVLQHGEVAEARYRLPTWLHDGKRLALLSDASGEEALEIHTMPEEGQATPKPESLTLDLGHIHMLNASPKDQKLAITNQRNELILVDVESKTSSVIDTSKHYHIQGTAWSPDGRWLAYDFFTTPHTSIIKLLEVESNNVYDITKPVLYDFFPAFDPEGKYLYFISYRHLDPVYDALHFDLGFPKGGRPFLITLQADTPSPFASNGEDKEDDKEQSEDKNASKDEAKEPIKIELENIQDRLVAFPVPEGQYEHIFGIKGKVLFSSYPVEGALNNDWFGGGAPPAKGKIEVYDFATREVETLLDGMTAFSLSQDAKSLIYRAGNRLRVLKAGEKPPEKNADEPGRKSGWLDLNRIKISVSPQAEWTQIYREAWRKQRDHFWTEDMSGIDWQEVFERYLPLLNRVATRSEVSDLLWEMQGELGTSHAYEFGGDYKAEPTYSQGFLAADISYGAQEDSYRIDHIVQGDVWDETTSSPLARAGMNINIGDRLIAINGQRLSQNLPPSALLVNQAGNEVMLTVASSDDISRNLTVKTLHSETPVRYREWVEANRQKVHNLTRGKVGYIHIPDMGARGYAEFHRGFIAEASRDGLIIDVRFNGGGHVSELLLEKLARKPRGYFVSRWGEPHIEPSLTPRGPMVALTDENAGSDGDIFSHSFKMMNLGPLIGKRTWGGVVGITWVDPMQDGGLTTQPSAAYWFNDVGWQVENYGTDPNIEVDISPSDDALGRDTQLERSLEKIQKLLVENPPHLPDLSKRPRLTPPTLPKVKRNSG